MGMCRRGRGGKGKGGEGRGGEGREGVILFYFSVMGCVVDVVRGVTFYFSVHRASMGSSLGES